MTRPVTPAALAELRAAAACHPDAAVAELVTALVNVAAGLPPAEPIDPDREPPLFEEAER